MKILPGNEAFNFTLQDIDGKSVSLSDFKGKVVFLDFWYWGCQGCMMEIPFAKELHEKYKGKDIVFINISCPGKEFVEREKIHIKKDKIEGINLIDSLKEVAEMYQVESYPSYFLIDKSGKIAFPNAPRPSSKNTLYKHIDKLLE